MAALAASTCANALGRTQCLLCERLKRKVTLHQESMCAPKGGGHLGRPSKGKTNCCRLFTGITAQKRKESIDGGGGVNEKPINMPDQHLDQSRKELHVRGAPIEATRRLLLQTAAVAVGSTLSFADSVSLAGEATPVDVRHMSNDFATLLMKTTYNEFAATKVLPEAEIQKQFFRLRQQEYPYFKESSTMSSIQKPGDLSEVPYFNFVSYIQWKIVAKHLKTAEERAEFARRVGRSLLENLRSTSASGAGSADLRAEVDDILRSLKAVGYVEDYSVEWREPGGESLADEPDLRIQLRRPADLQGSQLLRAEEGSFWQKFASSILQALFEQRGYESEVDEYFFQEQWQPPKSWASQLLLALGDPLQKVDVPFDPDILIQDWQLRPSGNKQS